MNLRNLFPHYILNPAAHTREGEVKQFHAFDDAGIDNIVLNWFKEFGPKFRRECRTETVEELFRQPRFGNGFVGYIETAAVTKQPQGVMLSPLTYCQYFRFGEIEHECPAQVTALMKALCGPNSKPASDTTGSLFGIIRI